MEKPGKYTNHKKLLEELVFDEDANGPLRGAVLYSVNGRAEYGVPLVSEIWGLADGRPLPDLPGMWGAVMQMGEDDKYLPLLNLFRAVGALPGELGQVLVFSFDSLEQKRPFGPVFSQLQAAGLWTDDFRDSSGRRRAACFPPDMPAGVKYSVFPSRVSHSWARGPKAFVWVEDWGEVGGPVLGVPRPGDEAISAALSGMAVEMMCRALNGKPGAVFGWDGAAPQKDAVYGIAEALSLGSASIAESDADAAPVVLLSMDMLRPDERELLRQAVSIAECGRIWGQALVDNGVGANWSELAANGPAEARRLSAALGIEDELDLACRSDSCSIVDERESLLWKGDDGQDRGPEPDPEGERRELRRIGMHLAEDNPPTKKPWPPFARGLLLFSYPDKDEGQLKGIASGLMSDKFMLDREPRRKVMLPDASFPDDPWAEPLHGPRTMTRRLEDGSIWEAYDDGFLYIPRGRGMLLLMRLDAANGIGSYSRMMFLSDMSSVLSCFDQVEWVITLLVPRTDPSPRSNGEIGDFVAGTLGDDVMLGYCDIGTGAPVDAFESFWGKTIGEIGGHYKLTSLDGVRPASQKMLQKAYESGVLSKAGRFSDEYAGSVPPNDTKGDMRAVLETVASFSDVSRYWAGQPWELDGEEVLEAELDRLRRLLPDDAVERGLVSKHPLDGHEDEVNTYVKLIRHALRQAGLLFLAASGNRLDEPACPVSQGVLDYIGRGPIDAFEAGVAYDDIVLREVGRLR